jgi:putative phosphoribosyl transferase
MFRDRIDAGRQLAQACLRFANDVPVVLALPRGGVPVAAEVARALGAPLDVVVVRKVGVPYRPELAMGAVGEDGVRVRNDDVISAGGVPEAEVTKAEQRAADEVVRRARRFREGRERVSLEGRTAIVVDDGIATGATAQAALHVVRELGARHVVLAVPVGAPDTLRHLRAGADEVICLYAPALFHAVGQFYDRFEQVSDDEVVALLRFGAPQPATTQADADPPLRDDDVVIPAGPQLLEGHLTIPERAVGLVVFAHGSGSSRHSPRNRQVARALHEVGLGTLLFDLLSADEEFDRANVFDIGLLATRLSSATTWLRTQPEAAGLHIGYFGASTGAAAALWAASEPGNEIGAVVSRGGRPDLALDRLGRVQAPTLLVVGSDDDVVVELNRQAAARMQCERKVEIVLGATHLFEEPGALDTVARLAGAWFAHHLAPSASAASR